MLRPIQRTRGDPHPRAPRPRKNTNQTFENHDYRSFEQVVIKKLLRCGAVRNLGHPAASFAFPHGTLRRAAVESIARVFGRLIDYQLTVRETSASFLRCVRRCVWGTLRPRNHLPYYLLNRTTHTPVILTLCCKRVCRFTGAFLGSKASEVLF